MDDSKSLRLGASPGFLFWAKHAYAMDELYELYDADDPDGDAGSEAQPELAEVWSSTHREALIQVFEHVEHDRDRLLNAAYLALERTLGAKGSPFRLQKRRPKNLWIVGAYADPTRRKIPQGTIRLTIRLNTAETDWNFYATIWAKGGRSTARIFSSCLVGVEVATQVEVGDWDNGSAFLSRVKLLDHLSDSGNAIDLDSALQAMTEDFRKQTHPVLELLLDGLRESG